MTTRILTPLVVILLAGLPLAAQQFDQSKWGKNTGGAQLIVHEGPREHTPSGTVLNYALTGTGFPADKTYDLWFWITGKQPEKDIEGVSFDSEGMLVCSGKPGACSSSRPDEPIDIKTTAVQGEPKRFGVISRDGQIAAFAEAVPFPIQASDKNCKLSVVRETPLAEVVAIRATGFVPFEMLTVTANMGSEQSVHSPTVAADGTWQAVVGTKPPGERSGVADIKVAGQTCTVDVRFNWGEGSEKEQ